MLASPHARERSRARGQPAQTDMWRDPDQPTASSRTRHARQSLVRLNAATFAADGRFPATIIEDRVDEGFSVTVDFFTVRDRPGSERGRTRPANTCTCAELWGRRPQRHLRAGKARASPTLPFGVASAYVGWKQRGKTPYPYNKMTWICFLELARRAVRRENLLARAGRYLRWWRRSRSRSDGVPAEPRLRHDR